MDSDCTIPYIDILHHHLVCNDVYSDLSVEEQPARVDITEFLFRHLGKEEVILCPGIEIPESVDHHHMPMLDDSVLDVVCFGHAPAHCGTGLLDRLLCLNLKTVWI